MSQNSAIEFSIKNATNDENVIYVTQDASKNVLHFTFTYNGAETITLKGGKPVPSKSITADGPSSLYFTISSILTPEEFSAIKVTPPTGWQAERFTAWALTPINDIEIKTGDSFQFTLSNITADSSPGAGSFNVENYNIPKVQNTGIQLSLFLEQLPSNHKDIKSVLSLSFVDGNEVFIDVDDKGNIPSNTLVIRLNNTSTKPIVPQGTPWKQTPVFYLAFVTAKDAPGYGALTTVDRTKNFSVHLHKDYGTDWVIQERVHQDPPHWAIYPKSPEILGVGADAMVEFAIEDIVTDFAPSSTNLYLLSSYIPGYDDNSYALAIEKKVPELAIKGFDANSVYVKSGEAVKLVWKTFDADSCTLSPVNGSVVEVPTQEPDGYTVNPKRTTTYTLVAHNNSLGTKCSEQLTIVVEDVKISKPLTADPAIGSHSGKPVSLSWATISADSCTIDPDINGSSNVPLSSDGTIIYPTKYTRYTLTANGQGGPVHSELDVIPIPNGWKEYNSAGSWKTWGRPVLLPDFNKRLWFLAGGPEAATSYVFNSIDGSEWVVATNNANYAPRGRAAGCVFDNKIWLMGGQLNDGSLNNEIWNSDDGINWTQVTANSYWCPRAGFACLSFAGKIWVIGGIDANDNLLSDVWNSTDGVNWSEVSSESVWAARTDFGAAVFDGKLCLIAGRAESGLLADAWQSSDGINWKGFPGNIGWPPRSNPYVSVVSEKLYVIGGTDQTGKSINDSNIYSTADHWKMGIGPGWDNLLNGNSAAFCGAIWCAGGTVDKVTNSNVWGYGPP